MSEASCIFCRIIAREVPAKVVAESDQILVIQDIAPKAPVHYLIIPKKHIKDITSLSESDAFIPSYIMLMAKQLASHLSGSQAFRLLINNGPDAGQSVFHLHAHFISGKKMLDF
ncbi:MAG: HIT domain-containing protein [Candidatus Babeliales bacterium]